MSASEIESRCRKLKGLMSSRANQPDPHLDSIIQSEIWLALWEADDMKALDISEIEVIVRQCEVWLEGRVEDAHQQQLAECLVNGLNGVHSCHNELHIKQDQA